MALIQKFWILWSLASFFFVGFSLGSPAHAEEAKQKVKTPTRAPTAESDSQDEDAQSCEEGSDEELQQIVLKVKKSRQSI